MLSFFNIWTIARYETKVVLRSWFFRIFSGIAILILVFLNALNISAVSSLIFRFPITTILKIVPSAMPFINIKLLNIVQAVIAIFIATDFLKRDRKLDTTEVIYARSMTNADYILGKSLGLLLVFFGLNLIVLLITALFQLFIPGLKFVLVPYLVYPLLISFPTLIFIIGLAYLIMSLIRNQAVTFIILLAYVAIVFFINQKVHYIYDYFAFQLPMLYSDFVGFAGLGDVLFQRGMYLFFGLSFIFFTILRLKRLIQSKPMNNLCAVLGGLFLILALFSGFTHLSYFDTIHTKRSLQRALNAQYAAHPQVQITDCALKLKHRGEQIDCDASVKLINKTAAPIDEYLFSLNPGLAVQKVSYGENELTFGQNQHILKIKPAAALQPGQSDSLLICYSGEIDEAGCFLDIDDEQIDEKYQHAIAFLNFTIKKKISFVTDDYLLLTPEALWYPVAGLPYGAAYPKLGAKDFVRFDLEVLVPKGMTALAQGRIEQKKLPEATQFHFKPENALPRLTLVIGKYERREIMVDSVSYSLLTAPAHDHFAPYFNEIGDTLGSIIRDLKVGYEDYIGFAYPFTRCTVVEVPIQFCPYKRLWTMAQETMQPEMILLSEQGIFCEGAEFEMMSYWMKRRQQRGNITKTPQEIQGDIFTRFAELNFIGAFSGRRIFRSRMGQTMHDYRVFPNYYTFINHFESEKWPIFNMALESSIRNRKPETQPSFFRMIMGLSDQDKCNLALKNASLQEILLDSTKKDLYTSLIENKGKYLFLQLQEELGQAEFTEFMDNFLKQYRHQSVSVAQLVAALQKEFNYEFTSLIEQWYHGKQLPGYLISKVTNYKVMDGDRTRSQVKFIVENPEPIDGILNLQFWLRSQGGGRMRGGPPAPDYEMNVKVKAHQKKEIGVLLDDDVRGFNIDTYISKNIPVAQTIYFKGGELKDGARPFQGERILTETEDEKAGPIEIIVDNEDPGFEIITKKEQNWLQKLFGSEDENQDPYVGYRFWNLPGNWTPTVNDKLYGKYIHSGYFIKGGDGKKQVAWHGKIPESGEYEVYAYYMKDSSIFMRRRGRRRKDKPSKAGELNFIIQHDDGQAKVALDRDNSEDGWNFLETVYLSEGDAKIVLTDQTKGANVFADAVKWVKK